MQSCDSIKSNASLIMCFTSDEVSLKRFDLSVGVENRVINVRISFSSFRVSVFGDDLHDT